MTCMTAVMTACSVYTMESLMKDYPYDRNNECMFGVYNRRKITLMSAVMNACSVYTRESLMKDYPCDSNNECMFSVCKGIPDERLPLWQQQGMHVQCIQQKKDYPYVSNNECMFSVYKGIPDERVPLWQQWWMHVQCIQGDPWWKVTLLTTRDHLSLKSILNPFP